MRDAHESPSIGEVTVAVGRLSREHDSLRIPTQSGH